MTVAAAVLRYQAVYGRLRTRAAAQAALLWAGLGGPDDGDAERFLAAVLPLVTGAEVAAARLLTGYLATVARLAVGQAREAAVDEAQVTGEALRGVAPAVVYTRPVVQLRTLLGEGRRYDEAMRLAGQRAATLAETDVMLAQRAAMLQAVDADERIVGYRRVLTGKSCMFCATAATQRYRRGDLLPIHPRCDCACAPVYATADPGQVVNRGLLAKLKAQGPQYWKQRGFVTADGDPVEPGSPATPTAVREHGELGPVLVNRHHGFTGEADIAA